MTIKQMNIKKRFKLPLIFAVLSVVLMGLYKKYLEWKTLL